MTLRSRLFLIFLTITVFGLVPLFSLFPATVTLAADTWCPYNCGYAEGRGGYMLELAE